ncbi:MAG: hypothetical protein ACYS9X_01295 [Planctomycetota bacterium]
MGLRASGRQKRLQGKTREVGPAKVRECYRGVDVCFIAENGG